jgi:preprotein translocase subunit YajC
MIFIFVIFYFLLIAPMRKKQRKTQEMLTKLQKGDEVITRGGIFRPDPRVRRAARVRHPRDLRQHEDQGARSAIAGLAGEPEAQAATPSNTRLPVSGLGFGSRRLRPGPRRPETRNRYLFL